MKHSSAIRYVVQLFSLFAEEPERLFSAVTLARALRLPRASCQTLLVALVESGFLYRTRNKNYIMGPKLAAIGAIPDLPVSYRPQVQAEMRYLALRHGATCLAIHREGDECVLGPHVQFPRRNTWSIPQGARAPLRVPFAATYYAWSSSSDVETWLAKTSPTPTATQRHVMFKTMTFAREHGFCFYVTTSATELTTAPEVVFHRTRHTFPVAIPWDLVTTDDYPLNAVVAPVLDAKQGVSLVLSLQGFAGKTRGEHIEAMGRSLRAACDRLGTSVTSA